MLPELYKRYNCYDDGKISSSRRYEVLITDIIKWEDLDPELRNAIQTELDYSDYLYKSEQEYILFGVSYEQFIPKVEIFAETWDSGWFGIGEYAPIEESDRPFNSYWCSGRLDIDGTLTDSINSR